MSERLKKTVRGIAQAVDQPLLALDTSASCAGVALVTPAGNLWVETPMSQALPSEALVVTLERIIDRAQLRITDLGAIVVGLGPGSYTGLRVGLSTAKGLGLGAQIPLVGCSSLALWAAHAEPGSVVVVRDALREAIYVGIYRVDETGVPHAVVTDTLMPILQLGATLKTLDLPSDEPLRLIGDCALSILPALVAQGFDIDAIEGHAPDILAAFAIAQGRLLERTFEPLEALVPLYLRPSLGA